MSNSISWADGRPDIRKSLHIIGLSGLATALFLALTEPAHADAGVMFSIGADLIRRGAAPAGFVVTTCFSFFVVLFIEYVIIWRINRTEMDHPGWKALWISFAVNILSTLGAVALMYIDGLIVNILGRTDFAFWFTFIVLVSLLWYLTLRMTGSHIVALLVPVTAILGIIGYHLTVNSYKYGTWSIWLSIPLLLSLSFGVTLALEAYPLKLAIPRKNIGRTLLKMNIASYIFLLITAPFIWYNPILQADELGWPVEELIYQGKPEEAMKVAQWMELSTPELLGLPNSQPWGVGRPMRATLEYKMETAFEMYCLSERLPGGKERSLAERCDSLVRFADLALAWEGNGSEYIEQRVGGIKYACGVWPDVVTTILDEDFGRFEQLMREWHTVEIENNWYDPGYPLTKTIIRGKVRRIDFSSFDFVIHYLYSHEIDENTSLKFEAVMNEIEKAG